MRSIIDAKGGARATRVTAETGKEALRCVEVSGCQPCRDSDFVQYVVLHDTGLNHWGEFRNVYHSILEARPIQ